MTQTEASSAKRAWERGTVAKTAWEIARCLPMMADCGHADLYRLGGRLVLSYLLERTARHWGLETPHFTCKTASFAQDGRIAALLHNGLQSVVITREEDLGAIYEELLDYTIAHSKLPGEPGARLVYGRRRQASGTHFTPPDLAAQLVRTTLEPLIHEGPESGAERGAWRLRGVEEILALRIVDLACGAGALLLAACRFLAASLQDAERACGVSPRGDLAALRAVAQQCVMGVDQDADAVFLTRASLWLLTRGDGDPELFLSTRVVQGDALRGEEGAWWNLPESTPHPPSTPPRSPGARAVTTNVNCPMSDDIRTDDNLPFTKEKCPDHEFSWSRAFPDVAAQGGFDALVSNPPFLGGRKIRGTLGAEYLSWLTKKLCPGGSGNADLCAYFLRRACQLLRPGGQLGLVATNTIGQGDTRETGLQPIVDAGYTIRQVCSHLRWPGAATVRVTLLWATRGAWNAPCLVDGVPCQRVDGFLRPASEVVQPYRLHANVGHAFQGSIVLGMGFILSEEQAQQFLTADPRHADVIQPYLTGADVSSDPRQKPTRWVINFRDWPLRRGDYTEQSNNNLLLELDAKTPVIIPPPGCTIESQHQPVAADYPKCLAWIETHVKPERTRRLPDGRFALRRPLPQRWWQFADKRPALYQAIAGQPRVLVKTRHSPHCAFVFVPANYVFQESLVVFPFTRFREFAILSSSLHEIWAWSFASTLGEGLRYSPSDCFDTFPLPTSTAELDKVGQWYYDTRQGILHERNIGLTTYYNHLRDSRENRGWVESAREARRALDSATLLAYGWDDCKIEYGFGTHGTGKRFGLTAVIRQELLGRLARLNLDRHHEELARGVYDSARQQRPQTAPRRRRQRNSTDNS